MGRTTLLAVLLAAGIGSALAVYAVAQGRGTTVTVGGTFCAPYTPGTKEHPPAAMACPACMMMAGEDKKHHEEMATKAGITEDTMHLCQGMGHAPLYKDSPAVLLGMAKVLKLTDDQKKQLEELDKEARDKALKVLTGDQAKIVEKLPAGKATLMEMRREMHTKMMKEMMKEGKEGRMCCCPMMMKEKEGAETKPAEATKETKHQHTEHEKEGTK